MARRTPAQRKKDMERTAELYLRGVYQSDIAAELGVSQMTISNDLKALYRQWQESALIDINAAKARELARIDELERTYWAEWEASKTERVSTATERTSTGDARRDKAVVRKEQRLGDPQYLRGVQWCIERRAAILGIDAPQKRELSGRDGKGIELSITSWRSVVEAARNENQAEIEMGDDDNR